jgi:hypothetical protein
MGTRCVAGYERQAQRAMPAIRSLGRQKTGADTCRHRKNGAVGPINITAFTRAAAERPGWVWLLLRCPAPTQKSLPVSYFRLAANWMAEIDADADAADTGAGEYGPAFASLTARRKRFVLAMASAPLESAASWARAAGFSDASGRAKSTASELLGNSAVRAAIFEVAKASLEGVGPILAAKGLIAIASDSKHPQQLRALEMIANRVGFHEEKEIKITHHNLTGEALIARVTDLAQRLGLDAARLIGSNVLVPEAPMIEARAVEVEPVAVADPPPWCGLRKADGESNGQA